MSDDAKRGTKPGNKRHMSQGEERRVHAFFDRELDEDTERSMRRELNQEESGIRSELEELTAVRQELRAWLADKMLDSSGHTRKVDLWSKLEPAINSQPSEAPSLGMRLRDAAEQIFLALAADLSEAWRRPAMLAPVATFTVLAFIIGFYWGSGKGNAVSPLAQSAGTLSREMQTAVVSERQVAGEAPVFSFVNSEVPMSPAVADVGRRGLMSPREQVIRLVVPNHGAAESQTSRFEQLIPLSGETSARLHFSPVPGGLRAGKLDIDWIKSSRRVKIISAGKPEVAPVIWLSKDAD